MTQTSFPPLGPISLQSRTSYIDNRGPWYAVETRIGRTREYRVGYRDTAEQAEKLYDWWVEDYGGVHTRIHPPQDSVDLEPLARAREETGAAHREAIDTLRVGVLRALEEGRAEAEVARAARVDRMTVRKWAGK